MKKTKKHIKKQKLIAKKGKTRIIVVSGTPGTGKTKISKIIAKKKKYRYVDVNKIISAYKLKEGYERSSKTYLVDVKKLFRVLAELIAIAEENKEKGLVIDSHLSHYLSPKKVDLCIITKADLKILKKRLEKRGYSRFKVRENLDSEIFDVCFNEARELKHKIKIVWTTKKSIKPAK